MFTRVLAQATVTDLDRAQSWYDRLFERPPDATPMPGLLEYHLGDSFGVQVFLEPDRAGRSSIVLSETDLDATAVRLREAGLTDDDVEPISAGRALMLTDPDGNRVVLVAQPGNENP